MLNHFICLTKGHMAVCTQEATLYPDGGGILRHSHACLRCDMRLLFPDEPLPDELDTELRNFAPVSDGPIKLLLDPSFQHRSDLLN